MENSLDGDNLEILPAAANSINTSQSENEQNSLCGEVENIKDIDLENDENSFHKILEKCIKTPTMQLLKDLDKPKLIKLYTDAMEHRQSMRGINKTLNHKLLTNINKNKLSIVSNAIGQANQSSTVSNETLQQYNDLLKEFDEIQSKHCHILNDFNVSHQHLNEQLSKFKSEHDDLEGKVSDFLKLILDGLTQAKPINKNVKEQVDVLTRIDFNLVGELSTIQLENLKLQGKYNSLKEAIQTSNETMTGCHLIDYEQLTAENQSLQEKIDDRIKEVQKLDEKTNQEITGSLHIDEKLNGFEDEFEVLDEKVKELDTNLSDLKRELNEKRIEKDLLNKEVAREQNKCVTLLFSSKKVLKDFEKLNQENKVILNYESELLK